MPSPLEEVKEYGILRILDSNRKISFFSNNKIIV
jgi:hypothetical protein